MPARGDGGDQNGSHRAVGRLHCRGAHRRPAADARRRPQQPRRLHAAGGARQEAAAGGYPDRAPPGARGSPLLHRRTPRSGVRGVRAAGARLAGWSDDGQLLSQGRPAGHSGADLLGRAQGADVATRKKVTAPWEAGVRKRLGDISRALEAMISGDLECQLPISPAQDDLDAICYGVNVLVGELGFVTANLRRARAEAEAANAAKSSFLRTASHELRTPLAVIVWLAELVKDPAHIPPDRLESFLTGIHRSARELLRTTEAILDLSRLEQCAPPPVESTDVIGAVSEALTTLQPLADRKGLTLCVAREPGAPDVVMTFAQHLRQVIVNLVANSIKFSARGEIIVRIRRLAATVAVDVEDSGIGIPAAMHDQIFEPFFQVDRVAAQELGGAGLGLALARRLAEGLGGALALLASTEGVGSTFRVTIPLKVPAAADVA